MRAASRGVGAAAGALGAYLTTVLPRVRGELRRWGPLPKKKAMNVEAVSVFATLAPLANRATVVRAITALQIAIDYRDTIEEGNEGWAAAGDAYLERLESSWRREAATLPSYPAVSAHLERAVERCEAGQAHTHAAAGGDVEPLRRWASALQAPAGYRWWEIAAGASSSVAAHALIAAAADPLTTAAIAARIDAAYHPPIGALTVLLDDLIDLETDRRGGEHNYIAYYASSDEAGERLALIAKRAAALVAALPRADRHTAILEGVAGFYLSAAGAATSYGQPIRARMLEALGPGARLLVCFMRLRRGGERKRPGQAGNPPGP